MKTLMKRLDQDLEMRLIMRHLVNEKMRIDLALLFT